MTASALSRCVPLALVVAASCHQTPERQTSAVTAAAAQGAHYGVTLEVDAAAQVAHLTAEITGLTRDLSAPESVTLRFPRGFAFVTLPPDFAVPVTASSQGKLLPFPEDRDGFTFEVDTDGSDSVEISWSVRLQHREHAEVIAGTDQYEHSYVDGDHGMLFTAELIPLPEVELASCDVRVQGAFADTTLAPWPALDPGHWTPTPGELSDDILLIGDGWQTVTTDANGLLATFAMAPGNAWVDPLVEELLVPIVNAEVDLFGWAPRERYLFVFGPAGPVQGYGGSPKTGSMTLFASADLPKDVAREGIAHLIAHEFHHTFGRGAFEAHDDLRFVSEGYTDYYAYIVPWRLGMISESRMHRTLESMIFAGANALEGYGRSLTAAGGPEFFAGRDAYQSCYAAGLALALWTDLALRQNGHEEGLDAFLREWYRAGPNAEPTSRGLADWETHLRASLPSEQVDAYLAAVTGAGPIDWESLFDRVGLVIERTDERFEISPTCLERLRR